MEDRFSRSKYQKESIKSNIIVTEPRRDASYNSLLDMKETERRNGTDRGLDHELSIKPYLRKNNRNEMISDRIKWQSYQRNYSETPSQISMSPSRYGKLYRPKHLKNRTTDHDSSFENERKMYESGSNSRLNSNNRSATPNRRAASAKDPIQLSGIDLKRNDYEEKGTYVVKKESIGWMSKPNSKLSNFHHMNYSFENSKIQATNYSLVPHMYEYLDDKGIKEWISDENKRGKDEEDSGKDNEEGNHIEYEAIKHHKERLKRITSAQKEPEMRWIRNKQEKGGKAGISNRLCNIKKKSRSNERKGKRRSASRKRKDASRSKSKKNKSFNGLKKPSMATEKRKRYKNLPPKYAKNFKKNKLYPIRSSTSTSTLKVCKTPIDANEKLKEKTDSLFLQIIDNLRELRKNNFSHTENKDSRIHCESNRNLKTEIEFESNIVDLINWYNKCIES